MQAALGVRIGHAWFRWRSLSPVPFFLALLLLPPDFRWAGPGALVPLVGLLAAEGLRIWAVGYAGSATRTRGTGVGDLVHAGPYRYVRNPLYVANILLYTLCGVLYGFVGVSAGLFLWSCAQYHFIVEFEEETLVRVYGERYEEYRCRVPRWLPSPWPAVEATPQTFDLWAAVRSERSTLAAMALLLALRLLK